MYCVVWQYEVKEEKQSSFEKEYGAKGVWSQFFSTSPHYKGSQLSKCVDRNETYLLLDWWNDASMYHSFLKENENTYKGLSKQVASLYRTEMRLGEFESLYPVSVWNR
jgi:hypothetical protein